MGFFRGVTVLACVMAATACGWAQETATPLSPEAQAAVELVDEEDAYVRQMGFMRLEALREPATAPVVRRYLDSRDSGTRAFAARALAAIEKTSAIPALIGRLKEDHSAQVRVAALLALEPLQDQDANVMPALIEKLRDRNPQVRMAAVDAVSRLDHPQAREAILARWRRERNRDVRRVLQQAIDRLGTP